MALIGGGGAGNVAGGSNPSGTGTGLNYIGDRVYAYSGIIGATSSGNTYLLFTTGNQYIVGGIICNYAENQSTDVTYQINFDGQVIQKWLSLGPGPDTSQFPVALVIPPYTKVEVIITAVSGDIDQTVTLTGRVYG